MSAAQRGEDVTAGWRAAFREITAGQSGECPPGMDLTFVLLFYCDVLAAPAAYAAALGPWVLDVSPAVVEFALAAPFAHPLWVRLGRGAFRSEEDPEVRREAAEAAYRAHALSFADLYAPGSRLSSHQRRGLALDAWDLAWAAATRAAGPARRGCCLIYAMPGAHACAGCPRVSGVSQPPVA